MGLLGERLHQRDVAIGIVLSMSLGLGLLFLNFFTAYATQATTLLFGNILGVDAATVWTLLLLGIVAIAALAAIARPLLFASLQPELAEAKGVSLRLLSVLFLAIVALGVAECVQIVGVLLVFALMVGPAAAAQRLTTRFWSGIALSVALALSEAWLGLVLAFYTDWPTSFWITALSSGVYLVAVLHAEACQQWAREATAFGVRQVETPRVMIVRGSVRRCVARRMVPDLLVATMPLGTLAAGLDPLGSVPICHADADNRQPISFAAITYRP